MRNLKRALSLALASVMLLGMMVVGTSAASYPDVDAADNLEAIEVLKAVGVMTGDENGNFNPDSMVTRNEMAVVMTNLLGLTPGGTTPFTDVPAWAQPYVAACYNYGIIAGTSATTFNGSANVTAVQASLMVMKALGYFGFQGEFGDDWKLATVKQANVIDLYDGINAYTDKNMNRNEIAKMVLNALESDVMVVTEQGGLNVEGNGIVVNQKPSYDYNTNAADRNNCNYNGVGDGVLQLCEKLYGKDLKKNSDTTDAFNRPATQWSYKTKNITTPKAAAITYTTTVKEKTVYSDLGLNSNQTGLSVYINGNDTAATTAATIRKSNSSDLYGTGNGVVTEIYLDDNKNVTAFIQYNEYLVQANEDYDAADANVAITVKSSVAGIPTELKSEDFPMVVDVKEDDYLLITVATADNGATYSVKSVKAAEIVSDVKVSEYKASSYVVAGGTKYNYNATAKIDASALGQATYMAGAYTLTSTGYDLVLDSAGYVIGVEPHTSDVKLGDYLFVKDSAQTGFQYIAKVLFMDGTSKTVTVAKVKGNDGSNTMTAVSAEGTISTTVSDGNLNKECYYTFTTNKNGEYELSAVAAARQNVSGTAIVSTGAAQPVTGVAKTATNSTVFIAKDVVYTGVKNAPALTAQVYCLLDDAAGNNYILAAYADAVGASSTNASDYVYVIAGDATAKDENDKTYYVYDAVISGVKTTIKATTSGEVSGLYKVASYSDGYAVLGAPITTTGGNVVLYNASVANSAISHKDGTVNVGGSSHVLDKDVLIYTIDARAGQSNAAKVITAGALNSLPTSSSYIAWGIQVSASDSDLAALILVRTA